MSFKEWLLVCLMLFAYSITMGAVIVSAQRSAKATAAQFQALHEAAEELKAAVEKRAKEEGNVES